MKKLQQLGGPDHLLPVHEGQFSRSGGGVLSLRTYKTKWALKTKRLLYVCWIPSHFTREKLSPKGCVWIWWPCQTKTLEMFCPNVKTNGFCRLTHGFPVVFTVVFTASRMSQIWKSPQKGQLEESDLVVFFPRKRWIPSQSLHQLPGTPQSWDIVVWWFLSRLNNYLIQKYIYIHFDDD